MYRRDSISTDIARCLYDEDWAVFEENGAYHISAACFQSAQTTDDFTIDLIISCMTAVQSNALIGFSEGTDQAVIRFATVVGYKLQIPSIQLITANEMGPLPSIADNLPRSCSLLLSYVSSENQLSEVICEVKKSLRSIKKLNWNISQVIAMVDEDTNAELMCRQMEIDFKRLTTLSEILDKINRIPSCDRIRIQRMFELLARNRS
jgi:hypothetical protein